MARRHREWAHVTTETKTKTRTRDTWSSSRAKETESERERDRARDREWEFVGLQMYMCPADSTAARVMRKFNFGEIIIIIIYIHVEYNTEREKCARRAWTRNYGVAKRETHSHTNSELNFRRFWRETRADTECYTCTREWPSFRMLSHKLVFSEACNAFNSFVHSYSSGE